MPRFYAGVDVGADRIHAAVVELVRGQLSLVSLFRGGPADVTGFCAAAVRVGVDASGGLSSGAHVGDLSVAPKFRGGRCSEIPVAGVPAVPWVTPASLHSAPGWMVTGFSVWSALGALGRVEVVESFPAACFHRLNGGRWPPRKTTPAGRAARLQLLSSLVELPAEAPAEAGAWSHDSLDAVACAVVAALGAPAPHACPRPDGSAMWVLGPGPAPSPRLALD